MPCPFFVHKSYGVLHWDPPQFTNHFKEVLEGGEGGDFDGNRGENLMVDAHTEAGGGGGVEGLPGGEGGRDEAFQVRGGRGRGGGGGAERVFLA